MSILDDLLNSLSVDAPVRSVLVGHFPFIPKLRPAVGQLWVIEQRPAEGDYPAEAAADLIPQADVVAITSSALINHTLSLLGMTAFGTLFSIYLTFLEPFVIGATCAWCLTSAIIMNVLLWLSLMPAKLALSYLHRERKPLFPCPRNVAHPSPSSARPPGRSAKPGSAGRSPGYGSAWVWPSWPLPVFFCLEPKPHYLKKSQQPRLTRNTNRGRSFWTCAPRKNGHKRTCPTVSRSRWMSCKGGWMSCHVIETSSSYVSRDCEAKRGCLSCGRWGSTA